MKIEVSEKDFIKNVKKCVREAASYNRQDGGRAQLYATHDGKKIVDYFISVVPDCNSWIEGQNLIHVTTQEFFTKDKNYKEHMDEWIKFSMCRLEERFDVKWI